MIGMMYFDINEGPSALDRKVILKDVKSIKWLKADEEMKLPWIEITHGQERTVTRIYRDIAFALYTSKDGDPDEYIEQSALQTVFNLAVNEKTKVYGIVMRHKDNMEIHLPDIQAIEFNLFTTDSASYGAAGVITEVIQFSIEYLNPCYKYPGTEARLYTTSGNYQDTLVLFTSL